MNVFAGHRWLLLLLGATLLAASYSAWSERLDGLLYRLMLKALPAIELPVNTRIVSTDGMNTAEAEELLKTLTRLRVAAIGWVLPLGEKTGKQLQAARLLDHVVVADPLVEPDHLQTLSARRAGPLMGQTLRQESPSAAWWQTEALLSRPAAIFSSQAGLTDNQDQKIWVGGFPLPLDGEPLWKLPLAVPAMGGYLPSLELLLVTQAMGLSRNDLSLVPGRGVRLFSQYYATDAELKVYPRPGATPIPVYAAQAVVTGKIPPIALRGKTVLIGSVDEQYGFKARSPLGEAITPVQWAALGTNAILNQSFVKVPYWSTLAQRGALLVLVIYFMLLPRRLRGWLGVALGAVLLIALVNGSLVLLTVQNTWLSFGLPAIYLMLGHLLLFTHHQVAQTIRSQHLEINTAYAALAANLKEGGQLDKAFEALQKCHVDKPIKEALYDIGLDFERRRQFTKAVEVYDYITRFDPRFRDIDERRSRHLEGGETQPLAATRVMGGNTTLVVDDPRVEKPVLGRYEIDHELGRGAMGTVYVGHDPRIGRTVAIKTMALTEEFEDRQVDEVRRRFFQEAETAGRLNHPNIVTIYDVGEEHDLAYIAMDCIKGESLDKHIRPDELLPLKDVFSIGAMVADALDYAHGQKVVHRDVKPANIIYDQVSGQLKVTDFGIACLTDNSKTRTGTVLGSPFYMSPEQISGQRVDGRSDLFSLGVTLYQLMSGKLPFEADSLTTLMYKIANDKPVPIRKVRGDLPACVTRLINKALQKDPQERYSSGNDMAEAIRRCAKKAGC
jgi:tRNA A-37 threonylcarbamoyl transferase component Bud32